MTASAPQPSQRAAQACDQCGAHRDGNWYERYGLILDLVQVLPLTAQALAFLLPHTSAVWPLSVLLLAVTTWVASRRARSARRPRGPLGVPASHPDGHDESATAEVTEDDRPFGAAVDTQPQPE